MLFEDSAALIGIALAAAGTFLSHWLDMPVFDPIASLAIGVLLGATAIFLAREAKSLLLGEPALPAVRDSIRCIAARQSGVERVGDIRTVHLGPEQVVAALTVDFRDDLTARDVEQAIARMERQIKHKHPEIVALLVQPKAAN